MKIDRHGQAKILTVAEIQLLFNEGFTVNPLRDRALDELYKYLEVKPEQVLGAVASLSMLAPIEPTHPPQTQAPHSFAAPDFELSLLVEVPPLD